MSLRPVRSDREERQPIIRLNDRVEKDSAIAEDAMTDRAEKISAIAEDAMTDRVEKISAIAEDATTDRAVRTSRLVPDARRWIRREREYGATSRFPCAA